MSEDKFISDVQQRLSDGEGVDDVTIIPTDGGKRLALILRRSESGVVDGASILGCEICILPSMIEHLPGGMMMISGKPSLPVSALVEDDSANPAMLAMRLCPECLRPIVHEDNMRTVGFEVEDDTDEW